MLILARKYVLENFLSLNNLKIIIATGVISVASYFLVPYLNFHPLLNVLLTLLGAGIVYIGLLLLFKEKLVTSVIKVFKKEK
jgi:hypothetical protein